MSVVEMLKTYQEGMIWIGLMLGLTERQLLMMSTVEMVAAIRETMGEHMDRFGQLEANEQRALALLDAFESGPQLAPLQIITQTVRRVPKLDSSHDYELGENEVLGMVFDHDDGTVSLNISIIPDEAVSGNTKIEKAPESYLERQIRIQSERGLLVIAVDHAGEPEGLAPGMYQDTEGNIVISGMMGGTISPSSGALTSVCSADGCDLGSTDTLSVGAPQTWVPGSELGVDTWVTPRSLVRVHEDGRVTVSVDRDRIKDAWNSDARMLETGTHMTPQGPVFVDGSGAVTGPLAPLGHEHTRETTR